MLISPQIYNLSQRFFSNFLNFLNRCSMILRLYLVQRLMISNLVRSRELDHILGRLSLLRLLSFFLHHTLLPKDKHKKFFWRDFALPFTPSGKPPFVREYSRAGIRGSQLGLELKFNSFEQTSSLKNLYKKINIEGTLFLQNFLNFN